MTPPEYIKDPVFTQRQALEVTQPSSITLEQWIRDGIVEPHRPSPRARLFSAEQLIGLDLVHLLVTKFLMRPRGAREIADQALEDYRPLYLDDVAQIGRGHSWRALIGPSRDDFHAEGFTRDADGMLRRFREGEDDPADSIMLVLPARLIARRVIAAIIDLPDASGQGAV